MTVEVGCKWKDMPGTPPRSAQPGVLSIADWTFSRPVVNNPFWL